MDGEAEPRRRPYSTRTWRSRLPQRESCCVGRSSGSSSLAGGTSQGTDPDRKRPQPGRDEIALPAIRQTPVARFGRRRGRLSHEGGTVRRPVAKHRSGAPRRGRRTRPAAPGSIFEDIGFRRPSADCTLRSLELASHDPYPAFLRRDRRWGHSIVLGSRSVRRSRDAHAITHTSSRTVRSGLHIHRSIGGNRSNLTIDVRARDRGEKRRGPLGASEEHSMRASREMKSSGDVPRQGVSPTATGTAWCRTRAGGEIAFRAMAPTLWSSSPDFGPSR
jgi:hypothetical protein